MYENPAYPRGHGVGLGRAEVHVEHDNCHAYTEKKNRKIHTFDVGKFLKYQIFRFALNLTHLNVSRIMVKSTNLPNSGTTSDVGGMISASSKKNTVSDSRMDIDKLTYTQNNKTGIHIYVTK